MFHLNPSEQVERCNYFLNAVVEVARREPRETPDGRLMSFLLNNPTCDGGQGRTIHIDWTYSSSFNIPY